MRRYTPAFVVALALLVGASGALGAAKVNRSPLSRTVPDMRLTGVALSEAIDSLRDLSGANIHVNWRALEEMGIGKDTPVNLRVRNVTIQKALNLILSEAGAGDKLSYYTDEGVIEITTREITDQKMITRVYPVDDLIVDVPNFEGPQMDIASSSGSGSSGGGGGGGSSNSLFTNSNNTTQTKQAQKLERANGLVALIMETLRPEIWRENGGTASIKYFNGNLIVTAPRSVHEALGGRVD
jgi:hypothetical protein